MTNQMPKLGSLKPTSDSNRAFNSQQTKYGVIENKDVVNTIERLSQNRVMSPKNLDYLSHHRELTCPSYPADRYQSPNLRDNTTMEQR